MLNIRQNWPKYLIILFLNCIFWGVGVAYAAPALWSYPNDHLLISEVNFTGAPGSGAGTEWVELYNPTNSTIYFDTLWLKDGLLLNVDILTPTPDALGTRTPYQINGLCSTSLTYDAQAFYTDYGQCPDYATLPDAVNCSNAKALRWTAPSFAPTPVLVPEIRDTDTTLCAYVGGPGLVVPPHMVDAVGWGSELARAGECPPATYPLPNPSIGQTILRGDDAPVWIGPGGEGAEIAGTPASEQLDEVWNLSGAVNVPWEGPESGVCRQPTAVNLQQNPHVEKVQSGGIILSFLGLLGLAFTLVALVWRQKPTHSH